jgi:hypothetical protein
MIRHWRAIATSLAGLVGVAGIMWVYLHYEAAYPDRYLAAVRRALDQGDRHEVDRLTNLLDHEGAADHVHFIRGEIALRQARDLHKDLELLGKSLQAERALRLGCGAALALCQPAIGREGCLLEIAYLIHTDIGSTVSVRRQTLEEQSRALLRSALWDYHHISKHDPLALEAAAPSGECFLRLKELGVTVPLGEAIKRLRVAVSREPENL